MGILFKYLGRWPMSRVVSLPTSTLQATIFVFLENRRMGYRNGWIGFQLFVGPFNLSLCENGKRGNVECLFFVKGSVRVMVLCEELGWAG